MSAAGDSRHPRLVAALARMLLRFFFRRVEVEGVERVPRQGPVVFVANHINALVDPGLLLAFLPRTPSFLAKSTLWQNMVVRPFLDLAAAIPVYRRQDGADASRNAETFARCHQQLARGGALALFPEGRSHNEPALVPLKTGVSRIVLEAEAAYGPLATRIVPVGLLFDDKGRFRSQALVQVGEPIDPNPQVTAYQEDPRGAVQTLTARVRAALGAVTLNYPSWQEARLIERAAALYARPNAAQPSPSLSQGFPLRQAFISGYAHLRSVAPERVAAVAEAVAAYDHLLALYHLRDRQVASRYPPWRVVRFVTESLGLLAMRLPLGLLGIVLNVLPYTLVAWIARRYGTTPDVVATYKLFASLLFYPVTWLLEGLAAGLLWGPWAGLAAAVVAPLSAYFGQRFLERRGLLRREARAFFLLHSGRRSMAALRQQRAAVLAAVRDLAAIYEEEEASSTKSETQ